ncbi:lysine methyltransferase [Hirsutella rhossiliensis]|uniref:Lysine methyltransferase domain-containing protein n=1 Tax=Hirsutella rhossiliensis TaxID=111463 RepID=A0A9P8MN00_9HYPO|nr:lysine methyltransferase domain-containing protein [Hirsutella rhossiliensis]KAH0958120.1 lysine methyltransferase domain-containing protein [Hirsutella rhossiliensis]
MTPSWAQLVDRFCRQYFQLEPELEYPPDQILRLAEVQDAIYASLFADSAVRCGPPERYRAKTLKDLVTRIEAAIDDWDEHAVSDHLMSTLALLLANPLPPEEASVQERCHVTYRLPLLACASRCGDGNAPGITLLEKRALISAAGTTGLRTWEAALHLGQYLCLNPGVVAGKRVLELGAGTGYLSILCAKYLSSAHVIASDGSDDVMSNLADNMALNHVQDTARVSLENIKWGHEDGQVSGGPPVDVILGADITYDRSMIPALVETLMYLLGLYPGVEAYISATQRNEHTSAVFLGACHGNSLDVEDLRFPVPPRQQQDGPFYADQVAIRICRVSRA